MLVACPADVAGTAPDPRIHQTFVANLDARRIRSNGHDFAGDLMAHGERQLDAAIEQLQALAATHLVVAVPDMQVAVADACSKRFEQDLRALGLGSRPLHALQRRAALADIETDHGGRLPAGFLASLAQLTAHRVSGVNWLTTSVMHPLPP